MRRLEMVLIAAVLVLVGSCGGSDRPEVGADCPSQGAVIGIDGGTLECRSDAGRLRWADVGPGEQLGGPAATDIESILGTACTVEGEARGFDGATAECHLVDRRLVWERVGGEQSAIPGDVVCGSPTNPMNPLALPGDNANVRASLDAFPAECAHRGDCDPDEEQSKYQWFRTDQSLTVDPRNPDRLLIGIERMGLFESLDRGSTWAPLSEDGILQSMVKEDGTVCWPETTRITFDPTVEGRIYLQHGGGGSVAAGVWQARGAGLYVSNDDGRTWDLLTNKDMCAYATALAISPDDPDTLYLGITSSPQDVNGQQVVCVKTGLVYRSTDGGDTWEELPTGWGQRTGTSSLWIDPSDAASILLGVFQYPPDPNDPAPKGTGLAPGWYRSLDGGDSWARVDSGPGSEIPPTNLVAVSPDQQVLFKSYDDTYVSRDGGASWTMLDAPRLVPAFDPHSDGRRVYAILPTEYAQPRGTQDEFTVSTDGGRTWKTLGKLPPEIRANHFNEPPLFRRAIPQKIVVHPTDPNVIFVAGAGALTARSDDGGATWTLLTTIDSFTPSTVLYR